MKELLAYVIGGIVKHKNDVVIREEKASDAIAFYVTVNPCDHSLFTDRDGQILDAVRGIINTASRGQDKTYFVVMEPANYRIK